ncbi:MAG: PaaI family thioesterase, partial [Deltaproteobacteria bacterium]|nr:PaaI family thioesterase [Deltaproteobacteria bacterium]
GLRLRFQLEGEDAVRTEFVPGERFQGWQGIVHGGILATLLDELMVNAVWLRGVRAVTGRLELSLRRPARVGERLCARATIQKTTRKTVEVAGQVTGEDGGVVAEGQALLLRLVTAPSTAPGPAGEG